MISTKDYLIQWFSKETGLEIKEINNMAEKSFFEIGWVDSLLFINFISDIEQNFNIEFSNEDFQNRAFSTVNGLSKIIERKMKK